MILTRRERGNLPTERFLAAKSVGGVDLYKAQLEATSVAAFEAQDYFGFVVSDLGQDEMVQLAASLAPAMRNALSGMEKAAALALLVFSVSIGFSPGY